MSSFTIQSTPKSVIPQPISKMESFSQNNRKTTTSKLGNIYNLKEIEAIDKMYHEKLRILRMNNKANKYCAECGIINTTWCSINIGVFLCMDCAQVHRSVGAHISKVKSCMGTYLWHPDEMERIENLGNEKVKKHYGVGVLFDRSNLKGMNAMDLTNLVRQKYENKPLPSYSLSNAAANLSQIQKDENQTLDGDNNDDVDQITTKTKSEKSMTRKERNVTNKLGKVEPIILPPKNPSSKSRNSFSSTTASRIKRVGASVNDQGRKVVNVTSGNGKTDDLLNFEDWNETESSSNTNTSAVTSFLHQNNNFNNPTSTSATTSYQPFSGNENVKNKVLDPPISFNSPFMMQVSHNSNITDGTVPQSLFTTQQQSQPNFPPFPSSSFSSLEPTSGPHQVNNSVNTKTTEDDFFSQFGL